MRRSIAAAAFLASFLAGAHAFADERAGSIVVWPTLTPAGDDTSPVGLHRPRADSPLFTRAQELDATMRDAVQDLGYTLDVADPGPASGHARDLDLIERAARGGPSAPSAPARDAVEKPAGTWVVSARLEKETGDTYLVRIVAVPPNGRELRVRVESVKATDIPVRGIVMLRDLLSPAAAAQAEANEIARERVDRTADLGIMSPLRSPGRAVLAVNGGLFGAYIAYSVQRASSNDDPRVLYPLLALGTGVGIGSALLVADEWDVSTGDAWFLAAGAWWGAGSAVLVANGSHAQPLSDRYAWGVGGGLTGLGLATFALTRRDMDEGAAALAHSGAALGFAIGGLAEMAYRGQLLDQVTPYTGTGYGSALGLVGAGTLATLVQVSPSRVLLVDLGVGLGGLAGAAAGSPLVFGDLTEGKNRGFVAATLGGAVLGGGIAWFLTRDAGASAPPPKPSAFELMPTGGVIGQSATPRGAVPAYGVGVNGLF